MKKYFSTLYKELYKNTLKAMLTSIAATLLLLLIGRDTLGEAVIALLYLIPIIWGTTRWGQLPGIAAAFTAAMLFDYFFIPPFYTFSVGRLEGWLVLVIFLAVAIVVVGRLQDGLSKARASEREAFLMYELSTMLARSRTQEAVAHNVARFLQERYMAVLVTVSIQPKGQLEEIAAYEPQDGKLSGQPTCVLPIFNGWGLAGEIQIWRGEITLPQPDERLFRNFAAQIGLALEHIRLAGAEAYMNVIADAAQAAK
jgi:K+-sensing histidine kinase KdpD